MKARDAVVVPLQRESAVPRSDRELVERALAGEQLALQLLYRRHVQLVIERVTRLLARSAEAKTWSRTRSWRPSPTCRG